MRYPVLCCLGLALMGGFPSGSDGENVPPAATAPTATAAMEPATLRRHVEYLASSELEGRGAGRGKALAARYIRQRFEELGLRPLFPQGSYFQEIPNARDGEPNVEAPSMGRNIGALLPGRDPDLKDEVIILSAHYDHLGVLGGHVHPGADDNAGSVAMMLEVARALVELPGGTRRTVVFLSCDLEERLLWGSRWFVAHPPFPLR
ncbi:MAG: M28 family peptidase, partial [Planctomycetales bacterium]